MTDKKQNKVDPVERALFSAVDPLHSTENVRIPALTTLLFRVCGNDQAAFEEATRVVELFIREALAPYTCTHCGAVGGGHYEGCVEGKF